MAFWVNFNENWNDNFFLTFGFHLPPRKFKIFNYSFSFYCSPYTFYICFNFLQFSYVYSTSNSILFLRNLTDPPCAFQFSGSSSQVLISLWNNLTSVPLSRKNPRLTSFPLHRNNFQRKYIRCRLYDSPFPSLTWNSTIITSWYYT